MAFEGRGVRLRDLKGLRYLARLLAEPGRELHVLELVGRGGDQEVDVSAGGDSGPLLDAAEVARLGIPTVMMFVQSLQGLSHNRAEDTLSEHLEQAVAAFSRLSDKTMEWIQSR